MRVSIRRVDKGTVAVNRRNGTKTIRTELRISVTLLDQAALEEADRLVGQEGDMLFITSQPGLFESNNGASDEEEEQPAVSAGRRRRGTRSSEHVPPEAGG